MIFCFQGLAFSSTFTNLDHNVAVAVVILISMYRKTKARVKVNCVLYEWIQDLIAMNQGGLNSPTLFRDLHTKCCIVISEDTILLHL